MDGPIVTWVPENNSCTASAIMCAQSWRISSNASSSFLFIILILVLFSILDVRSSRLPLTSIAAASLAKDLEIDSPYNTYKYKGLPPTPINNPGKNAVLAAIFPEKTDYIFFVADGTGGHKFAKKLSEHNRNVSAYRRWRSSQWEKLQSILL